MSAPPPFAIDRAHPPRLISYRGEDGALDLRPWTLADVDPLVAALHASLRSLRGFMPWAHGPITRATHYEVLARFAADYWAGREQAVGIFAPSGEILGGAGFHPRVPLNPRGLEIGYWGHATHAGRGNVTRAVKVLVAVAFDLFGVDRLQVMHDEANVASRRVIEKCGFVFEGVMRNATAPATPEQAAGGLTITANTRLYALCPGDLAGLPWLGAVRAAIEVEDALGARARLVELAAT